MKIFKILIRTMSAISLAVYVLTGEVGAAILLLVFALMSLGILVGEKIDGESKYARKRND